MRKNVFGRQLKRDANERKALFKNLLTSLVMHDRIQTTEAKAKAIKGAADKLVTKAKKGGQHAYRMIEPQVNHNAVVKLLDDIAPRFTDRQGGYTRIIRGRRRIADNAQMVYLEWTEMPVVKAPVAKAKSGNKPAKTASPAVKKETTKEATSNVAKLDKANKGNAQKVAKMNTKQIKKAEQKGAMKGK
jgi:large subunit ribosomal protein L17